MGINFKPYVPVKSEFVNFIFKVKCLILNFAIFDTFNMLGRYLTELCS